MNFKQLLLKLKNDTYLSHINLNTEKVRCEVCDLKKIKLFNRTEE